MNVGSIKTRIRRLLTALRSNLLPFSITTPPESCRPLLTIKEDIEEQNQFPHDFSFENTKDQTKVPTIRSTQN